MQSTSTNVTTLTALAAAAFASIAVLLYVSVARDFLPGIVELSAALSAALIFGAVTLLPRGSRQAMQRRLARVHVDRIGFVAAAVAVLALTALIALFSPIFPWPAPLLFVLLLMAFAIREPEGHS